MTYRHLLPDEIDELLDGQVGFGVAPLEAHIRECATCRAEIDAGRRVVDAIEHLPRLTASPLFAAHVMAKVDVYEPWHVAARDTVDHWAVRLTPRTRPMRVMAGAAGLSVAAVLSVACVWLASHLDAVFFFGTIARARLRDALLEQLGTAVSTIFGPQSVGALRAGGTGLLFAIIATAAVLVVAAGLAVRSAVANPGRTTRRSGTS
jgi:hypothetical protein